jgi:hypothetical protein
MIIFKIILFPVSLFLTIFVAVFSFLIDKCKIILSILSGILFLLAVTVFLQYFFGWPFGEAGDKSDLQGGIVLSILSFILSPYGVPTVVTWIIEKFDDLNNAIKSI